MGIVEQMFFGCKLHGGLGTGELQRLKWSEDENRKLTRAVLTSLGWIAPAEYAAAAARCCQLRVGN